MSASGAGTAQTKLIVLRGPSGSGKTATARALRERLGRRVALVEQDYLRRVVLKARDAVEGPHYGLIEQTVRYALDHGYDVILEGILHQDRYRELLDRLDGDHQGSTVYYYFDISWNETLRRHANRPQTAEFGADEMRHWWCPNDLLEFDAERLVPETASLAETTGRILTEVYPSHPVMG